MTEFRFEPHDVSAGSDVPESPWSLTPHQVRQLNAQVKACGGVDESMPVSTFCHGSVFTAPSSPSR